MTALTIQNLLTRYTSSFFNLNFEFKNTQVIIGMQLQTPVINTSQIAGTYEILKNRLPSVLQTKCFNDDRLPFEVEVNRTEVGHLFEHILIEELCIEKIKSGADYAEFSGRTFWDWYKNPKGTFSITLGLKSADRIFLPKALEKTIKLTEVILGYGQVIPVSPDVRDTGAEI